MSTSAQSKRAYSLLYFLILFLRIGNGFVYLLQPLLGWCVAAVLDSIDYGVALRGGLTFKVYQYLDKVIDIIGIFYMLLTAIVYGWQYQWLFVAMFIYRVAGHLVYARAASGIVLVLFPNFIEFQFLAYMLYEALFHGQPDSQPYFWLLTLVAAIAKIVQELLLHKVHWIDSFSLGYIKNHPEHERDISQYLDVKTMANEA